MLKLPLPSLLFASLVLKRVVAVLLGLELVYLLAANVVLHSSLVKKAVASADGMHLEYTSASSIWPGRVRLSGLSLRIEDYNVQFLLTIESAQLDVGLDELLHKRFHAWGLRAEGVRCRMRHKVHEVTGHEARLAAFPHIEGFSDPPLYRGPVPPPIPDDQYDLWQVQLEDVVANAKELWFLEYRFQGVAQARGSFLIRPARLVQVLPAKLEFAQGVLDVGPHHFARSVSGTLEVELPHLDVPKTEGAAVFHEISTRAKLALTGGDLAFSRVYLEPTTARVDGPADWSIDANIKRGVVQPGTKLVLEAHPLQLVAPNGQYPNAELSGAARASLTVDTGSPESLHFVTEAARLQLGRSSSKSLPNIPPPELLGPELALVLAPTNLAQPINVVYTHAKVGKLDVPNLFWFEPWLSKDGSVRVDGAANAHAALSCGAEMACQVDELSVALRGARIAIDDRASEPFSASAGAHRVALPRGEAHGLVGQLNVDVSSARAFLPLVTSLPIKDAIAALLDLSRIEAQLTLDESRGHEQAVRLTARSGGLTARGRATVQQQGTRGALLLSTGLVKFGVTLRDGKSSVSPFVGEDWLERAPH